MKPTIYLVQIILAVLLILTIIVQQKGSGLGSAFGQDMAMYSTRRGAEKLLFYLTIVLAVLFIASSVLGLLVS